MPCRVALPSQSCTCYVACMYISLPCHIACRQLLPCHTFHVTWSHACSHFTCVCHCRIILSTSHACTVAMSHACTVAVSHVCVSVPHHTYLPLAMSHVCVLHRSIGMPRLESIRVYNPSPAQSLHLNSISGDSPVFHASFFKSKVSLSGSQRMQCLF